MPKVLLKHFASSEEGKKARAHLESSQSEGNPASFAGFHGASLAFFLSRVLKDSDGPTLVVTATQDEAETLRDELQELSGRNAFFFPPWESLFNDESEPDKDIYHDRLVVLEHLEATPKNVLSFIVAPIHAVIQPVASSAEVHAKTISIEKDADFPRDHLANDLTQLGFRPVPLVLSRGEYSVRGDILDVFPFDAAFPLRVEYFGDTIDSIREFHPETQRSRSGGTREQKTLRAPSKESMFKPCFEGNDPLILDRFTDKNWLVLVDPSEIQDRAASIFNHVLGTEKRDTKLEELAARLEKGSTLQSYSLALEAGTEGIDLSFGSIERFKNIELERGIEEIQLAIEQEKNLILYCDSDGEKQRVTEIFKDHSLEKSEVIQLRVGEIKRGFEIGSLDTTVLTTRDLFNRKAPRRKIKKVEDAETQVIRGFFDLEIGDYVVHVTHGIGRYHGVKLMEKDGITQEFLELEYRNRVKVYVPASKIDLVQKYIGVGASVPSLDKVGGGLWSKRKESVENAIHDFAAELLEVQALRQERAGLTYPEDTEWQRQLEASFPYEDTPDQAEATIAVKDDLQNRKPMDRLLCGDVGYGKTEIAMRAAFKVVNAGKQVAVLVPTTVLAQQHGRTFKERMAGFPVRIEQISRFNTKKEAKEIVEAASKGHVDILIGTHRILSDDVKFSDLGLVVIDEEQRFGVAHKEKLKKMRAMVELLTLTATPIPRTLHMALLGIRDISSLSTPPEGRSAIATEVIEFDRNRVREAMLRELNREGQVYFVHNRVKDIHIVKSELQEIVPEARIEFAHGQMTEHQLEKIMTRFLDRKIDVLVCTTIIETGIDIPNVNTIFINECDRFGLSSLHQLRGRVGRSRHKAFCYLIVPAHRHMNPDAKKRMKTIREFSQLGAGFRIAMRDLEIRGAGNILGPEQSGHITQVGYDLYCRLLDKAVKEHQGQRFETAVEVEIDLNLEAFIPDELIPVEATRLDIYRRLSKADTIEGVEEVAKEIQDRCGRLKPPVQRLLEVQIFRILAAKHGLLSVSFNPESIVLVGNEYMKELLDSCPLRCVILSPEKVALIINEPGSKKRRIQLTDEWVFEKVFKWLHTGKFPNIGKRK